MPRTTDLPKAEIVMLYEQGMTVQELADRYEREFSTMRANLHRWGANVRRTGPTRAYSLDEQFFAEIDTEEKAYWLGFILTDGSIRKTTAGNWTLCVELSDRDRGHLVKLGNALRSTAPIKACEDKKSCYLLACSKRLCTDLRALGCVQNKTCNHGTPVLPPALYRHFYRGAIDGDGSLLLSGTRKPQWRCELVGAREFVVDFQEWLVGVADVSRTKIFPHGRAWVVRYTGTQQVRRICDLLYGNATIALDRKLARYRLMATPGG